MYEKIIINSNAFLNIQKIYLITLDKEEEYSYRLNEGAADMAKLTGANYIWAAPSERMVDQQVSVVNDAVLNGADLIMLQALDEIRLSSAVEEAKAKGVKFIYVDSPTVEEAILTLATNNYFAGQVAGQLMLDELKSEGIFSGDIGIIEGIPEMLTRKDRQRGFRDVIEADGRYRMLETRYSQGNPVEIQNKVEDIISKYPNLVGLFSTYEVSTTGMGYGIEQTKKPIIAIGFGMTDIIRDMLNQEVLVATLVQNPYTMGYLGMAEAIAALTGRETGPKYIDTGVSVVTKYMREII